MIEKPQRVQLSRRPGWRMPPNTVSVARPTKWGNPFRVAPKLECQGVTVPEITPDGAVQLYRQYIERMLSSHQSTRNALASLRGKNLACWCRLDRPCHADILLDLANADGSSA